MIATARNGRGLGSSLPALIRHVASRVVRVYREGYSDAAIHHGGFVAWKRELARLGKTDLGSMRMLDVGCGDRAPLAAMFATAGASVDAIDLLPVSVGWRRPWMWFASIRQRGWSAAVRQVVRDALHTWRYWYYLRRFVRAPLAWKRIRFAQMDAVHLRFPENTFDIVYSSAVWEHVSDVRTATREVNRVLRPNGIAIIQIALFPALGGGHHAEWHTISPNAARAVRPWDHIRTGARPLPLYCNGWHEAQYAAVFDEEMVVQRWEAGPLSGKQYLTPDLRQELSTYSERDLLLQFVTVWAQKRQLQDARCV